MIGSKFGAGAAFGIFVVFGGTAFFEDSLHTTTKIVIFTRDAVKKFVELLLP